jgi:predicted ATP-dependent endonuclease of OLD family
VVITEGPSDPIILPALLREATGRPLPFQVVDRLASASLDELKALRGEIRQVAFVLDGDDSGRKRTKELRELKYTARQIVALRTGRTVEDLVDPDLYVRAVNRHLEDWAPAVVERFSTADLGPLGRVAALTRWCRARGLAEISHAAIAVEILTLYQEDEPDQRRLVARNRAVELKGLFAKIERAFE